MAATARGSRPGRPRPPPGTLTGVSSSSSGEGCPRPRQGPVQWHWILWLETHTPDRRQSHRPWGPSVSTHAGLLLTHTRSARLSRGAAAVTLCSGVTSQSRSVVSSSLRPPGLYSPWNSLGQNTGVGSLALLQGIFPTLGLNPGLPHCRWVLYQRRHQGSPKSHKATSKFFWVFQTHCHLPAASKVKTYFFQFPLSGKKKFFSDEQELNNQERS